MRFLAVGCNHRNTSIDVRELLSFGEAEICSALKSWRSEFPGVEAVILSTCNRTEFYVASDEGEAPDTEQIIEFIARSRGVDKDFAARNLSTFEDEEAIRHLLSVAASLDSMVVGEPQILAQVKEAYHIAEEARTVGPLLHGAFQAALRTARRTAGETALHRCRVSVPSVAVADFAKQIFERFDDKHVVVVGAGEMAEETLRYLNDEGATHLTIVNRSYEKAAELASKWRGCAVGWTQLAEALATADLVVSATGASETIVSAEFFDRIERARFKRPMFILDLAVPRDFASSIGDRTDVYLYSVDDLREACEKNRERRDKEIPAAKKIVEQETVRFVGVMRSRTVSPLIRQLRRNWEKPKEDELARLFNKLSELNDRERDEIRASFDRLVNKLLHPPLVSLRDETKKGASRALLDAVVRLFQSRE